MSDSSKTVRRSQVITGHGPGGLLDIGQESFICMDTTNWYVAKCQDIRLPRLERKTGASSGFKLPPVKQGFADKNPARLPYYRFPRWLFCPKCKNMVKWTYSMESEMEEGELPRCFSCGGEKAPVLAPMRFVLACKSGHIGDIDWNKWAHSNHDQSTGGQCAHTPPKLRLKANSGATDLSSLSVVCNACGAQRSLADLTTPAKLKAAGIFCSGKQPWQYFKDSMPPICKEECRAEQRGASNIYYPQTLSALDIPGLQEDTADSDEDIIAAIKDHPTFSVLKMIADAEMEPLQAPTVRKAAKQISTDLNIELDMVLAQIGGDIQTAPSVSSTDDGDQGILRDEWPWLTKDNTGHHLSSSIEPLSESDEVAGELATRLDKIILVKKLREVRCLRGFSRIDPGGEIIPPDLGGKQTWLPAIEVFGEGIFIKFDEGSVRQWSQQTDVVNRIAKLRGRFEENEGISSVLRSPSPRLVMLHTFAHLMIRQLCFECGYSASSLRERIYCDEPEKATGPMAGVLIYTADTDSEGSLGGLCRQGEENRLSSTILSALDRGSWCSSDPVCSEVEGQGLGGLNRAACHACSLVAETSCTMFNCLLDRELVIGSEIGYFRDTIKKLNLLSLD